MKKFIILIITVVFSLNSYAQKRGIKQAQVLITGRVIDLETKQALEYATVIFTPTQGKRVTGGITDNSGKFNIQVPKGIYTVSVEFISFKTKTFKNKKIDSDADLGSIFLEFNAEALDEIEIIAEKSTVEIRLDKKIYNVGKDMTVKGGTASDVLDNVPSVSVDVEGNVSLRGNENVRILINGKPSGLVGLSGTDALRQLPAEAIEKVEVITSPSARYEAEGTAGIINIILRKGKAQGFNASLSTSAGNPDNFGISTNLNYRTKKANFFTNTGYNYRNAPGNSFSNVTYFDDLSNIDSYRNENINYNRERKRFNTRIGLEYFLTEKSSITGTVLYRKSDGDDLTTNLINQLDQNNILNESSIRQENETEKDKTIEYDINFTKNFNKSGHRLSLDIQYGVSEETNFNYITDITNFPDLLENAPERNSTDEKQVDFQFKGDYTLPIGEDTQFEFGFKIDLDELDSDYLVEDYITNEFINNTNFSNTLNFEQNIYAAYSQFGKKIDKFSYLLGLRAEITDRKINLIQSNEIYNKKYTELFPTLNLGLELDDTESLTLGYSRRLRRPRHWFLNPFESRISETYIRKGNVNLDPTYTNSFDLGYLKRWNKFTFNTSIYYQHSINNFEMIQTEELRIINDKETLVIIRTPINLSTQDRFGYEFTANYNPFNWWKISNSFNLYKVVTNGDYDGVNYDSNDITWFTRFTSRISLPGKIEWQTRGMYRAPYESAQSKREGMLSVNLAFSKDILKEKGTLSLNVSDLFNSRKRNSESFTPTTTTISEFQWRQRQIMLNFTYRFNQKKKRERQGNYNGGGEEEMFKA
ncbi:MAG: TonB-dependent receptor [Lutibacter sp.]|nr:MAG: TonB-dependent receptor [Lutibacter sp.]